jgi:DNA excision repair protein ERCC-4
MKTFEYIIVVDTREQKPLWEGDDIVTHKLDVGDYSILGLENKICIERKSCGDLYQTLTIGMKRFKDELERARQLDYFAIMVEGSFEKILGKKFTNSEFIKTTGKQLMNTVSTLRVKYGVHIIFCQNRTQLKKEMKFIFEAYLRKLIKEGKNVYSN